MQVSKTKAKNRSRKKTNPELKETIALALKEKAWLPIAKSLSGSTRNYVSINLSDLDKKTKVGDTVLVLGKVLSKGSLTKKIRICALSISELALERLKETKSEFVTVLEEIQKNKKAEGLLIIK
tara:strand:- start:4596 stop:4967 length:372 start_codon:yes stop_codon:yes gene_type:complete